MSLYGVLAIIESYLVKFPNVRNTFKFNVHLKLIAAIFIEKTNLIHPYAP